MASMNHFLIIEGGQFVPVHLSVFHMRAATFKTVLNIVPFLFDDLSPGF